MRKWKRELDRLPTDATGRKEAREPTSTKIVLQFLRDEIYPRLELAKGNLVKQGLNAGRFQSPSATWLSLSAQ